MYLPSKKAKNLRGLTVAVPPYFTHLTSSGLGDFTEDSKECED